MDHGWVPHDEGTLAQPAARVLLHDQLPHRDFDDMYTGGQALYHAAVFRALGVRLLSLRIALFGAFLLTLPLLWYVGTRFAGPVATAGGVLVAAAWSIPVYPAAMPSWYNLFLAVGAVAAALRHLETGRRRWLVAAGVCVGLSIAVKVAGFYMLAALLLFAVHREQELSRGTAGGGADPGPVATPEGAARGTARLYSLFVTASLAVFVVVVGALVRSLATPATVFHFVLPPAALAGWLVWREWREVPGGAAGARERVGDAGAPGPVGGAGAPAPDEGPRARLRRLAGLLLPILAGATLPVAAFLLPYLLSGSVDDLLRGVFVLPADRFEFAVRLPPGLVTALPLAGLIVLTAWAARADWKVETAVATVLAVGLAAVLVLAGRPAVYRGAWWLLRPLIPLLVLAGVARLAVKRAGGGRGRASGAHGRADGGHVRAGGVRVRAGRVRVRAGGVRVRAGGVHVRAGGVRVRAGGADRRTGLFLLLSATALASLVQFPTSAPVYFFYAAPLAALLALALLADLSRPPWPIAAVAAVFHVAFAVAWIHTGWVYQMGDYHAAHPPTEPLGLERGGIEVVSEERVEMQALKSVLDQVAPGPWIWATPDAPEVYFLMERRNPTRTLFDFFDEPEGRGERILRMLEERDVGAVVYNTGPAQFSGLPPIELQRAIAERYPRSAEIGRFFVRWKAEASDERGPPAGEPGAEP